MPRVVVFYEPGSADVLKVEERPIPELRANEVLLSVEAIGLNRAELAFRLGKYLEVPNKYPSGLGFEAVGIIQQIGSEVTYFRKGQRVATLPIFSMHEYGSYGELVVMPEYSLTLCPEYLPAVDAASIWMAALTAYGGLIYTGGLTSGEYVIISAASSGVGAIAMQMARSVNAKVIATTRNPLKKMYLMDSGAYDVLVTTEEDMLARVAEITSGAGADVMFDAVGGSMVSKLVQAASFGGRIVLYGTLSTELTVFPLLLALQKCVVVHAYRNLSMVRFPEQRKKAEKFILDRLEEGVINPSVDRVFPLTSVVEAHRYMESNQQCGKIVLVP